MGVFGIIGSVITFPFRLIFGKKEPKELPQIQNLPEQNFQPPAPGNYTDVALDTLRAKIDLMVTQVDNIKIEYETLNQRMQNMERMIREIYAMAKS